MIKRAVLTVLAWCHVSLGGLVYLVTGHTPMRSYLWFIRLFCLTGGRSNDCLSAWVGRFNGRRDLSKGATLESDAWVQNLEGAALDAAVRSLREDGYYILSQRLPADVCERLQKFALHQPSVIRADDMPTEFAGKRGPYEADRGQPKGVRYDFDMQDILRSEEVQCLMCNTSLLSLAQTYFGSVPRADVLGLWWNTAFNSRPSDNAAQMFHFDMDRIKWLKVFIYLTDVHPENGPHSFVAGSHKTGGIPAELLSRGYARLTDQDVAGHYPPDAVVEFPGVQGTILIEDTRGLHKGKLVQAGDRLVLQLQFSNSLFGTPYPKSTLPAEADLALALRTRLARDRDIFEVFI